MYTMKLLSWEPEQIKINFNITNPLYVNRGSKPDEILLLIIDKEKFRSKIHGRHISDNETSLLWT